jgi:hypothetical protein
MSKRTGSLSLACDACNPYYEHPRCEMIQAAFPLAFHLAQPIWAGARSDKFTGRLG